MRSDPHRYMNDGRLVAMFKTMTPKTMMALLVVDAASAPEKGQAAVDGRSGIALVVRGLASEIPGLRRHVFTNGPAERCAVAYRVTARGCRLVGLCCRRKEPK